MEDKNIGKGWKYLVNSPKWHFFNNDNKSLCGRWATFSNEDFEYGNDESKDNCKSCIKKLKKLKEK